MVIFLYNLYIFLWIQHCCLAKTVFALDPINSVIKRFCYIWFTPLRKFCRMAMKFGKKNTHFHFLDIYFPDIYVFLLDILWIAKDPDFLRQTALSLLRKDVVSYVYFFHVGNLKSFSFELINGYKMCVLKFLVFVFLCHKWSCFAIL